MRRFPLPAILCLTLFASTAYSSEPPPSRPSRASAAHIGSVMALLATLQDADVLPPETSPDANRIIHWAIQFQSVWMKSDDPAVRDFAQQALASTKSDSAAATLAAISSIGWTAELLDALAEAEVRAAEDTRQQLAAGFSRFNVTVEEFHQLMQLVRQAKHSFAQRGTDFRTQFDRRRNEMPGAGSSSQ